MANVTLTYSGNSQNTGNFDIEVQSVTSTLFSKVSGGGSVGGSPSIGSTGSTMSILFSDSFSGPLVADLGLYNNAGSNRVYATGVTRNQLTGGTYTVTGITCGDDAIIVTSKGDVNPQCTGNAVSSLSGVTETLPTFTINAVSVLIDGVGGIYTNDIVTTQVNYSGLTGEAQFQHGTLQTLSVVTTTSNRTVTSPPQTLYHGMYKFELIHSCPQGSTRPTGKSSNLNLTQCP
jgi:hypothetical protein